MTKRPADRDASINFVACLIDSVGFPTGMAFFSTATIIPIFMSRLHASNVALGGLVAMINMLVYVPGIFVVRPINALVYVRTYLVSLALVERLALLALAPLTVIWAVSHPSWLLAAIFVAFGTNALIMGLNQPSYWIVVGKCIAPRFRGRLFGLAGGIAGLFGIAVAAILKHLFAGSSQGFPNGYSMGFVIGFLITTLSVIPLGFVREPARDTNTVVPELPARLLHEALRVMCDQRGFRRFLGTQFICSLAGIATPFFVLYSQYALGASMSAVAGYTAIMVIAGSLGSLACGTWSDVGGYRMVLVFAMSCAVIASSIAFITHSPRDFYLVSVMSAISGAGLGIAGNNMVLEYAQEPQKIPLYTCLFNLVVAVPRSVAPLIGGLISSLAGGYHVIFLASVILAAVSIVLILRLKDPRHLDLHGGRYRPLEST